MKTDRELLELAAKAAGIEVELYENSYDEIESAWNPLTDDGDALRLAIHLGLVVDAHNMRAISGSRLWCGHNDWVYGDEDEQFDDDYATRRAIVHAAAAIGESMP